jgi:hypothetical protein
VENLVKKKYGMDKKQFVVEIANEMFNLQSVHPQAVPLVEKANLYYAINWIKRNNG